MSPLRFMQFTSVPVSEFLTNFFIISMIIPPHFNDHTILIILIMIPDVSLGWVAPLYTQPLCHTGPMCTDMDKVIDFDDNDEDENDDFDD